MKLVSAKCPSCGAKIDVDKDSDSTICEYCNSRIIVKDAIKKVSIEIKNLPKYENYVTLAERYYSEFQYKEARTYYKKALELDPNNIEFIFHEKICRACGCNYDKMNEEIVYDAFEEVREKITDKKELGQYVKASSNAMAYIINEAVAHYNLKLYDFANALDIRYRIKFCSNNIKYFMNFIDENDKETKLYILDHYISSLVLLTQDYKYKDTVSRKEKIYNIEYKEKKKYIDLIKEAEKEKNELLKSDDSLVSEADYEIPKLKPLSNKWINIGIFIIILLTFIFITARSFNAKSYVPAFFGLATIVLLLYSIMKEKKKRDIASLLKRYNFIALIMLVALIIIYANNIRYKGDYLEKWKSDNMILTLKKEEAVIQFSNGQIITGKYHKIDERNGNYVLVVGEDYFFDYREHNNSLTYIAGSDYQVLEQTTEDINFDNKKDNKQESSDEDEDRKANIVRAVFGIAIVCFIGWATKWRMD